jgi:TonB family protein
VLLALYWFNPLLYWAARRFRRDQELACDARVLARHPRLRRRYAEALLKTQLLASPPPLSCHWRASTNPLKERIEMLKHPAPKSSRRLAGMAALAALALACGYAAWAAQPAASGSQAAAPAASANSDKPAQPAELAQWPRVPPKYPVEQARQGVEGDVVLLVEVAADGSVIDAKVEKSTPPGVFDEAALTAARQWRFTPAMLKDGRLVEGTVRVPISFRTNEPAAEQSAK